MSTLTIEVEMPRNVISLLDVSRFELPRICQKLIALELFREGKISAGKGAELTGSSKWEFIQLLAEHKIDYIDLALEEVEAEVAAIQRLREQESK